MEKKLFIATNSLDGINTDSVIEKVNRNSDIEIFRYDSDRMKQSNILIDIGIGETDHHYYIRNEEGSICKPHEVASA